MSNYFYCLLIIFIYLFHQGVIPKDNPLIHLKSISEFLQFCIYLGLEYNECHRIERKRRDIDDQKIEMLQKWIERDSRTWRDFIKPFIMLRKFSKAKELVEKYSVIFYDSKINEMCPTKKLYFLLFISRAFFKKPVLIMEAHVTHPSSASKILSFLQL